MKFLHSIQSEWLKTKRSAASWLCLIGGFFIPFIDLCISLNLKKSIAHIEGKINPWESHFTSVWQYMASFILPMGIILASSLITQLEFKNNTWKQLHSTPQSFTNIFFAKFTVIILMTIKFFIYFNIGIIISGLIPCLFFDHSLPKHVFPFMFFIKGNLKYFIVCLPILAFQYLISLKTKNFLVPVGIGLLGIIGTLIGARWKYSYISPYSFCVKINYAIYNVSKLYWQALICFGIIMIGSYFLYLNKKEKG